MQHTKVLITGGGGFLGAWVAQRLLARGLPVRIMDIGDDRRVVRGLLGDAADKLEWVVGDVSQARDVETALSGCQQVVHLAGLLTPSCQLDPIKGAQVNLLGTLHVFEAAKKQGLRHVVYTSSVSVFGPDDGLRPEPSTHYGAFKLAAEGCARTYWQYDGISSVGLRPGVVYGPGREVGLSAGPTLACRAAARGEPYTIGYQGDTCLVYADDVAAAYEQALLARARGARVFNVSGRPTPMADILEAIRRHCPDARLRAEGPVLPFTADIPDDALYQAFPALPRTPLETGIGRTLAHYRPARA
ncbi:NAD-dependent epimerase/dehydratase family protein [Bordetella genomosp. 6]|uniref:Nucleoside-diphosphate sugar epimerase n=1 Tax=Bordetella genomosp. 6 TaxID=463024 RepID=A0ABX4FFS8_9BORD|nr:NAD-dependent epimerase/dehydratase [Bordetella genomosp. 6]OZI81034.1 nucleoside-diphosphate sugar epimerase [Bordetella genomosp. 6]